MLWWDALDSAMPLFQLLVVYMAFVFAMLAWRRRMLDRRKREQEDREETLESKLRLLAESSTRAAALSSQIKVEIAAMTEQAEQATAAAKEAQRVAEISEEERAAVAALVRQELGSELKGRDKRGLWANVGLSALFFVLGVIASIVVTMNVRPSEPAPEETPASLVLIVETPVAV